MLMNRLLEVNGARLRQLRRERAWSQRDLAGHSGVSQDTITRLETGQREAQPRTMRRLAEALGTEPRELMKRSGDA
jgi:transcriptional regulator with XRE-family HTH domain